MNQTSERPANQPPTNGYDEWHDCEAVCHCGRGDRDHLCLDLRPVKR